MSNLPQIHLIGGGTISHVRNHLALCAPAYGSTVKWLSNALHERAKGKADIHVHLTKMADPNSFLETNEDIAKLLEKLIANPATRVIVFNPALIDFSGQVGTTGSGKYSDRLETSNGQQMMTLTPTHKLIANIRSKRKDIFVVGFKTTTGASTDEQYRKGLELLKKNSINLVLANDTVTRNNMIIAPEETRYAETPNRDVCLEHLATIILWRMNNTFTRSTVVEGDIIPWKSKLVPDNLRDVVNHCIKQGAYKPVLGKTAGHFAVKVDDGEILTSIRKTNYNELDKVGLVRVEYEDRDSVIAHGAKPSVGGMSQRIIFTEHPEAECIVHFHCPPKGLGYGDPYDDGLVTVMNPEHRRLRKNEISIRPQIQNECGSHQCGQNTSDGLAEVDLGDGDSLKMVYLDEHGPNIVFSKKTPAKKVIDYIDRTFDLKAKTGGLVA